MVAASAMIVILVLSSYAKTFPINDATIKICNFLASIEIVAVESIAAKFPSSAVVQRKIIADMVLQIDFAELL